LQLHVFKGTDTHTHEAMLHIYASWGQKARLLVKENGMIAGVDIARRVSIFTTLL